MTKEKQIELLASAIGNLENALFLETVNEAFWQAQTITGSKSYQEILGQTQLKVRAMEAQILFYRDRLKRVEDGTWTYEPFKKKK